MGSNRKVKVLVCICATCCQQFPERKKIKIAALRLMKRDPFMLSRSPKEKEGRNG